MLVRATILIAAIWTATGPLAAEPRAGERQAYAQSTEMAGGIDMFAQPRQALEHRAPVVITGLEPAAQGDILAGRGPDPHAGALRRIAVAVSLGNRDAVEIAAAQLRQFGVTGEELQEAVDGTRVHDSAAGEPLLRQSRIDPNLEAAWKASQ